MHTLVDEITFSDYVLTDFGEVMKQSTTTSRIEAENEWISRRTIQNVNPVLWMWSLKANLSCTTLWINYVDNKLTSLIIDKLEWNLKPSPIFLGQLCNGLQYVFLFFFLKLLGS